MTDRIRQDKIAVGKPLHERAGSEPIGTVIREVRFTDHEESWNGTHEIVIYPEPSHRIVRRRVNSHGCMAGIFPCDPLIHVEKVPITLADHVKPLLGDDVGEIQVHAVAAWSDAAVFVTHGFHGTGCNISWCEIAETWVSAFQKVVAFRSGNILRRPMISRHL